MGGLQRNRLHPNIGRSSPFVTRRTRNKEVNSQQLSSSLEERQLTMDGEVGFRAGKFMGRGEAFSDALREFGRHIQIYICDFVCIYIIVFILDSLYLAFNTLIFS